jgi:hypothetical protein
LRAAGWCRTDRFGQSRCADAPLRQRRPAISNESGALLNGDSHEILIHPARVRRRIGRVGQPRRVRARRVTYPSQPLRIVVPYPAGGATDTLARIMATKLQESWRQTVVVENKPGASGTIGNDLVAKAPRDGHTILLAITAIVQVQSLMPKLPYDALKDLQPLVQVASTNSVFVVPRPSRPAR